MDNLQFADLHFIVHPGLIIVRVLDRDNAENVEDAVFSDTLLRAHIDIIVLTNDFVLDAHWKILCHAEDDIGSCPSSLSEKSQYKQDK